MILDLYLPYPDIVQSASAFSVQDLSRQAVRALHIYLFLEDPFFETQDYPAVAMWEGYENFLAMYIEALFSRVRAETNELSLMYKELIVEILYSCYTPQDSIEKPWWFGDPEVHENHQDILYFNGTGNYGAMFYGDRWEELCPLEEPTYMAPTKTLRID